MRRFERCNRISRSVVVYVVPITPGIIQGFCFTYITFVILVFSCLIQCTSREVFQKWFKISLIKLRDLGRNDGKIVIVLLSQCQISRCQSNFALSLDWLSPVCVKEINKSTASIYVKTTTTINYTSPLNVTAFQNRPHFFIFNRTTRPSKNRRKPFTI